MCLCGDSQCPSCGLAQGTLEPERLCRACACEYNDPDPVCPDCGSEDTMDYESYLADMAKNNLEA